MTALPGPGSGKPPCARSAVLELAAEAEDACAGDVAIGHETAAPDLRPPGHGTMDVHVDLEAADACDRAPVVRLVASRSSEEHHAIGDDERDPDVEGAELGESGFDVPLRSERGGTGSGRACAPARRGAGRAPAR